MRPAPNNQKYTTAWKKDGASGLLFRLSAGTLQTAVAGEDGETPVEETVADAFAAASFGGLEMSNERLEAIERERHAAFLELWRTLPQVTVVIIPREDLGARPISLTAALHDWRTNTGLPEPVADFNSANADDSEGDADILLKLIRQAVTAWRRDRPDEWDANEVFDTIALVDALAGDEVPAGLPDALQAHGILHLDTNPDFRGHWDDSFDLTLDDGSAP